VVHLTGQGREVDVAFRSPRYLQRAFLLDEMADALHAATVVVSRAGLGTLSEIGALGLAAIVIPMPGSHQLANARAFAERRAADVLNEETLTSDVLADRVLRLIANVDMREALGEAAKRLLPLDAADRVADRIRELVVDS